VRAKGERRGSSEALRAGESRVSRALNKQRTRRATVTSARTAQPHRPRLAIVAVVAPAVLLARFPRLWPRISSRLDSSSLDSSRLDSSRLVSSRLDSSHLFSSRLVLFRFVSSRFDSSCLPLFRLFSSRFLSIRYVSSCLAMTRTKQTAKKSTGGPAPRLPLVSPVFLLFDHTH
jgi:hypothetical protein